MTITKVYVSKEKLDQIAENNKSVTWCTCEATHAHFVEDTPEMKHHWICDKCGFISQIG